MTSGHLAMAFFRADLEDVTALAEKVVGSKGGPVDWRTLPDSMDLHSTMAQLPSPHEAPNGLFFTSPACAGWTGLTNRSDGWSTLVHAMTRMDRGLEALTIRFDRQESVHPSTAFQFFQGGVSVRRIGSWKEGNEWHFVNRGSPLPIEDASHCSRRSISARFDRSVLTAMLAPLGIGLVALLNNKLGQARVLAT